MDENPFDFHPLDLTPDRASRIEEQILAPPGTRMRYAVRGELRHAGFELSQVEPHILADGRGRVLCDSKNRVVALWTGVGWMFPDATRADPTKSAAEPKDTGATGTTATAIENIADAIERESRELAAHLDDSATAGDLILDLVVVHPASLRELATQLRQGVARNHRPEEEA